MGLTSVRLMFVGMALGAGIFALDRTASASHVQAEIAVPTEIQLGESVDIRVTLRSADEGLALRDNLVTLYIEASFLGGSGWTELGQAVTDERGIAVFEYEPRLAGDHRLRVEYLTPGQTEPEALFMTFSAAGSNQSDHPSAATRTPWLNWWIIFPLGAVVSQIPTLGIILYWRRLPEDRHRGVRHQ